MDVKQAYRNIPVHPNNRGLLSMHWEGQVYVDNAVGMRSAPLLFIAVADALQWVMQQKGVMAFQSMILFPNARRMLTIMKDIM